MSEHPDLADDGIVAVSWDGEAWARYGPMDLSGSVDEMAFRPDGSAWVTTSLVGEGSDADGRLYVITPEAVSAAE